MSRLFEILNDTSLSPDVKVKLVDFEKSMTFLEKENLSLRSENLDLKSRIQEMERTQSDQGEACPYCKKHTVELVDIKLHDMLGEIGVKIYSYKCSSCGREFEEQRDS